MILHIFQDAMLREYQNEIQKLKQLLEQGGGTFGDFGKKKEYTFQLILTFLKVERSENIAYYDAFCQAENYRLAEIIE